MLQQDKTSCSRILKSLLATKCAAPFKEPADPVYYDIPDYFDIVKNPMDLGTIKKKKLENYQYESITGFVDDTNLMFNNCYLYNNETYSVCRNARVLEGLFKKLLQRAKDSSNSTIPTPKKAPVKMAHYSATPISHASSNDNGSRSGLLSDSDDRSVGLFGKEDLSEEGEVMEVDEKRGVERAATDREEEMPEEQNQKCSVMINELKKQKYGYLAWAFKEPVDTQRWECDDYYDIVKHPMDMSTYEQKFITNQYQHEDELAADIRLMFNNCFLYNPPDNPVNHSAKKLQNIFEKYWSKLHTAPANSNQERPKKKLKDKKASTSKRDGHVPVAPTTVSPSTRPRSRIDRNPPASASSLSLSSSSTRPWLEISRDPPPSVSSVSSSTPSTSPRIAIDRNSPASVHPAQQPPQTVSIFDIVYRWDNEKKLREEEEQRKRKERDERATKQAKKESFYRENKEAIKKADRERRMAKLNAGTINISRQKMLMNQFESDVLRKDGDFHDMHQHYKQTLNFRTNTPLPFLQNSDLDGIRDNLLSEVRKYEGDKTGMEELD